MKKYLVSLLICIFAFGLVTATTATAKDDELVNAMVQLERAYIPPLFFTNKRPDAFMNAQQILGASKMSLKNFRMAWNAFSGKYADYRPSEKNWGAHFKHMEEAISAAEKIVGPATVQNVPIIAAHEELEAVRAAFLDLRTSNGFPKFITDDMTEFHDPMEKFVLPLMNAGTPDKITDSMMMQIEEPLNEAMKAWSKVEKCPIDFEMWGMQDVQIIIIKAMSEITGHLNNFSEAYENGDKAAMLQNAMPIKQKFVGVYTSFGGLGLAKAARQ